MTPSPTLSPARVTDLEAAVERVKASAAKRLEGVVRQVNMAYVKSVRERQTPNEIGFARVEVQLADLLATLQALEKTESAERLAFLAGWNARETGSGDHAEGRDTALRMFLRGFNFGDADTGEDLARAALSLQTLEGKL